MCSCTPLDRAGSFTGWCLARRHPWDKLWENVTIRADETNSPPEPATPSTPPAAAHPTRPDRDPASAARGRRRRLPDQALRRRHRRGLRGHLPRRSRAAARRRALHARPTAPAASPSSQRIDAHLGGVRWAGRFTVDRPGVWQYTIEAWTDQFGTWRDELARKVAGGQPDLSGELSEGVVLLRGRRRAQPRRRRHGADRARDRRAGRPRDPGDRQARHGARRRAARPRSSVTRSATAPPACRSR